MDQDVNHVSVMPAEVLEYLDPQPGQCLLDGTLGLAGHAQLISQKIGPKGHLIGIDQDKQSLAKAKERLSFFQGRLDLCHSNFSGFDEVLKQLAVAKVDGMIFDLGISSFQLDNLERGFSFKSDGPLDMRMDQSGSMTAGDLVNELSEVELADVIFQYGEERFSRRIARGIIQFRQQKPFETVQELEQVIFSSVPAFYRRQKIHPATRTFQALRIAVNKELDSLQTMLGKFPEYLREGGRIAVISFHSLEDRLVKERFRELSRLGNVEIISKKPLRPGEDEVRMNSRSRSARLRVAERISCS